MSRALATEIALQKLALVGLAHAAHALPAEVSGGMRKRAGIARAIARDPDYLFLDEPSAGLDPITAAEMDDLITTIRDRFGTTIVVITHELASLHLIADRLVMLAEGKVLAEGSFDELSKNPHQLIQDFFNRKAPPPAVDLGSFGGRLVADPAVDVGSAVHTISRAERVQAIVFLVDRRAADRRGLRAPHRHPPPQEHAPVLRPLRRADLRHRQGHRRPVPGREEGPRQELDRSTTTSSSSSSRSIATCRVTEIDAGADLLRRHPPALLRRPARKPARQPRASRGLDHQDRPVDDVDARAEGERRSPRGSTASSRTSSAGPASENEQKLVRLLDEAGSAHGDGEPDDDDAPARGRAPHEELRGRGRGAREAPSRRTARRCTGSSRTAARSMAEIEPLRRIGASSTRCRPRRRKTLESIRGDFSRAATSFSKHLEDAKVGERLKEVVAALERAEQNLAKTHRRRADGDRRRDPRRARAGARELPRGDDEPPGADARPSRRSLARDLLEAAGRDPDSEARDTDEDPPRVCVAALLLASCSMPSRAPVEHEQYLVRARGAESPSLHRRSRAIVRRRARRRRRRTSAASRSSPKTAASARWSTRASPRRSTRWSRRPSPTGCARAGATAPSSRPGHPSAAPFTLRLTLRAFEIAVDRRRLRRPRRLRRARSSATPTAASCARSARAADRPPTGPERRRLRARPRGGAQRGDRRASSRSSSRPGVGGVAPQLRPSRCPRESGDRGG